MWISSFAIRNPVVTVVVVLALVVFGLAALLTLDTDEFPEVNPPVVTVSIPYPGASPETVEREVVTPLEEAFLSIPGIDEVNSTSSDGFASLIVIFDFDKDVQQATQDIRDKISELRRDLPVEMEEPALVRFDPNDLPIVSLTLSGDRAVPELTRLADPGIVGALRGLPGVADVQLIGGVERELTVELQPRALQAAGIGVAQVVQALQAQNLAAPVGRVSTELDERTIRLLGRFERPEDFKLLVLSARGDRIVRLGDVADVRDGSEEPRSLAVFNGARAVGIDVKKATSASTTAVSERIGKQVAVLQQTLPPGVELRIVRDAGIRVAHSVRDVQMTLLEGAALTVLVVFLFLASWRSTVITGLALPVSVLASFVAVWAFGFTLNSMSLLGLSLAIGILIDDAIVVRENIVRHMQRGKDHMTAAHEGTAEIGLAVAATTFAIVVVFVPVAFMGGIAEQWFAPFALTIAASVLVSLFVSFSLDPMLSAYWSDPQVEALHTVEGEGSPRRSFLTRPFVSFNRWFDRQTRGYERVVAWALRHRLVLLGIASSSFVAALAMPAFGVIGSSFFPLQDRSELYVELEAPPGASLEYTRRRAAEIEALARAHPEVSYVYTTIGGLSGQAVDEATLYVRLVEKQARKRSQHEIEAELRTEMRRLAGISASMTPGLFASGRQIQVQLTGPDLDVLGELAERYAAAVEQVPGAVDVALSTKGQKPELEIVVDRPLAATMGVTMASIAQALRPAFAGIDAGDWIDPDGETRDVTVRLVPEARTRPADLERLPLVAISATGEATSILLGQIARITRGEGPAQIDHLDGRRVVTVGANTEGAPLSAVVAGIEERTRDIALPPGYAVLQGGETENQREVFGRILGALGVAVLLMYMILVIQFRSFLDPLAIMASLPLSLIGVMLALLITGSTLNLMSMIGVILLMGIVAKNAILLIDFAKWAEAEGLDRKSAIVKAGGTRLRPILMTSVAIIAGMLPVAIGFGEGGEFRAPLGRAVIGGVITSTLLTLVVIPTTYDVLCGWRDAVRRRVFRREAPLTPPPARPSGVMP
jgi:hydrophobic/amphiphilic exporter-1 (mainly G- bacteria), HAE1 family